MEKTHDALVKLALFCANQARTNTMKDAAREPWRLAVEYRDQAAKLGEPPDIGKKAASNRRSVSHACELSAVVATTKQAVCSSTDQGRREAAGSGLAPFTCLHS